MLFHRQYFGLSCLPVPKFPSKTGLKIGIWITTNLSTLQWFEKAILHVIHEVNWTWPQTQILIGFPSHIWVAS